MSEINEKSNETEPVTGDLIGSYCNPIGGALYENAKTGEKVPFKLYVSRSSRFETNYNVSPIKEKRVINPFFTVWFAQADKQEWNLYRFSDNPYGYDSRNDPAHMEAIRKMIEVWLRKQTHEIIAEVMKVTFPVKIGFGPGEFDFRPM